MLWWVVARFVGGGAWFAAGQGGRLCLPRSSLAGNFPIRLVLRRPGSYKIPFFFSSLLGSVGVCVDWSGKDGNFLRSSLD
jgi:hypothetical protein